MKVYSVYFLVSCAFLQTLVVSQTPSSGDALIQPAVQGSSDGVLDTILTLGYGDHTSAVHSMRNTRLFNGTLPGPTLKIKAGDTLKILFQNNLQEQAGRNEVENEFSYPDTSNLHFHGAHVSGELPSDDVTLRVSPGSEFQYESHFPANHMPGTHWIHPHVHGSGSLQVGGGAAMALIVEDPEDYLPDMVEDAQDVLLFVQNMDINTLRDVATDSGDTMLDITTNGNNNFRLVNGQHQPTVTMQPGEWQRWRIVYANWLRDPLDFSIDGGACEMQLLAKDGLYIQNFPRAITSAPIPSAGRADIMVRCPNAGDFTASDYENVLMNIRVEGTFIASTDLPEWSPPIPEYLLDLTNSPPSDPECSCTTSLQVNNACTDGTHCVNGLSFEADRFLHTIALGSIVERELRGVNAHPYHQHVYPFQLVDGLDGLSVEESAFFQLGDWHDVIMIESANRITTRYLPNVHLGRIMLHCHRLDHEDQGMMAQEDVIHPDDGGQCQCEANIHRETAIPSNEPTSTPVTQAPTSSPTQTAISGTGSPTDDPNGELDSSAPTGAITVSPTPPTAACTDSTTWQYRRGPDIFDCTDIAANPFRGPNGGNCANRIGIAPDNRVAHEACPAACGTCEVTTAGPTATPSLRGSSSPTGNPTSVTTGSPTSHPILDPTSSPSSQPTSYPTESPTSSPTPFPTSSPTGNPTSATTGSPTSHPTLNPTNNPSSHPTPTESPTSPPTSTPTTEVTSSPTESSAPNCDNSSTWRGGRGNRLTCSGVAEDPARRCRARGSDGILAEEACPGACLTSCQNIFV